MNKTPSGPSTGKALLNHTIFSPSQTDETVPLSGEYDEKGLNYIFLLWLSVLFAYCTWSLIATHTKYIDVRTYVCYVQYVFCSKGVHAT